MAKQSKKDPIAKYVKKGGGGTQSIEPGSDFGAREMWNEATNPKSVKEMVGSDKEFSPYKHDQT